MASLKTNQKAQLVVTRLFKLLWPFAVDPLPVVWDAEGKILSSYGGSLGELRKRGPGILELVYRELPASTVQEFVKVTKTPMPEPTEEEFRAFERQFLTAARRVIHREISKRLEKLPPSKKRSRGRPTRKVDAARLIHQTVREYEESGKKKTEAVKQTAEDLGKHVDTIWRYLRSLSHAKHALPRSTSQKTYRPP